MTRADLRADDEKAQSTPADYDAGGVFRQSFLVSEQALDDNRHVNNVVYLQSRFHPAPGTGDGGRVA